MKAVMLAAGVGRRLRPLTRHRPKCLMDVGGRTLLSRCLDALRRRGVTRVCMVVGYRQDMIRAEVEACAMPLDVTFLVNADYERGSIGSLWTALSAPDDDAVIMDADLLFHPALLDRVLSSPRPNVLLVDDTVSQRTEECMVMARAGRVTALSKRIPDGEVPVGEAVGMLRVSRDAAPALRRSVETCVNRGLLDLEYEDALEGFFREAPVGYETIGGLPWIEIDFPEDLERARRLILPRLPRPEEARDRAGHAGGARRAAV